MPFVLAANLRKMIEKGRQQRGVRPAEIAGLQ